MKTDPRFDQHPQAWPIMKARERRMNQSQAAEAEKRFDQREKPSQPPYSLPNAPRGPLPLADPRNRPSQGAEAEKRFEQHEKPSQPPYPLPCPLPLADPRSRPSDAYEGAALMRARSRATSASVSPRLFVMATTLNTVMASVLAVIITLGVVRQLWSQPQEAVVASAHAAPTLGVRSEPANAALQQIYVRPIGSPDHPLRLEPQRPAPLSLQIQPEEAANEAFVLALSGAPAGTILSGATQMSSDTWFLPPGSADRLEIALPEWSTSVIEIAIALRQTNGWIAAQTKAWLTVSPPPSRLPASPKADEATAKDLLARASQLLDKGDIVGARAIYQRAAELGSGSAALALGATYDPNRLWSLGALGLVGSKERARQWYQRAGELGHPEAKARLATLGF